MLEVCIPVRAQSFEIQLGHDVVESTVPEGPSRLVGLGADSDDDGSHVQFLGFAVFLDRSLEVPDKTLHLRELRPEVDLYVLMFQHGINQWIQECR